MTGQTDMDLTPDWEFVADGVMGGVSRGTLRRETFKGRAATVLRGDVSLDNNGGFIQMAFDLKDDGSGFDASAWDGIALELCGNGETYDIRLRTDQLSRPWQSFRAGIATTGEWQTVRIPFTEFEQNKTDADFDPRGLRRIGLLAIGREFHAELAVAGLRFYRA